jgi:hypothetical protein
MVPDSNLFREPLTNNQEEFVMNFNTSKFVASHGRAPRGYGMYVFVPEFEFPQTNFSRSAVVATGTYAQAKKVAREKFKGLSSSVVVCP